MVDLITTSPLVTIQRTSETDGHYTVPYYQIGSAIFAFGMTEKAADEFIELIDSGANGAALFGFYLYDKFAPIDELKKGFHKFFYHLIFRNQWMNENIVNTMCSTEELYQVMKEIIKEDQKKITLTEKIWPSLERDMLEKFDPQLELRATITTISSAPFFGDMRCVTNPSMDNLKVAEVITANGELLYSTSNRSTYRTALTENITKKLGEAGTSTRRENRGYVQIEIWDTPEFHSLDYVPGEGETLEGRLMRMVGVGGGYELRVRS